MNYLKEERSENKRRGCGCDYHRKGIAIHFDTKYSKNSTIRKKREEKNVNKNE